MELVVVLQYVSSSLMSLTVMLYLSIVISSVSVCVLQELLEEVRKELQKVKDEIIGGKGTN